MNFLEKLEETSSKVYDYIFRKKLSIKEMQTITENYYSDDHIFNAYEVWDVLKKKGYEYSDNKISFDYKNKDIKSIAIDLKTGSIYFNGLNKPFSIEELNNYSPEFAEDLKLVISKALVDLERAQIKAERKYEFDKELKRQAEINYRQKENSVYKTPKKLQELGIDSYKDDNFEIKYFESDRRRLSSYHPTEGSDYISKFYTIKDLQTNKSIEVGSFFEYEGNLRDGGHVSHQDIKGDKEHFVNISNKLQETINQIQLQKTHDKMLSVTQEETINR